MISCIFFYYVKFWNTDINLVVKKLGTYHHEHKIYVCVDICARHVFAETKVKILSIVVFLNVLLIGTRYTKIENQICVQEYRAACEGCLY
jgi:hypothetical protein